MAEPDIEGLAADLTSLESAVRQAAEAARPLFNTAFKRWEKSKGNPVTEIDIAIDRMLRRELMAARPSYGWLSEESVDDLSRMGHERVWIVDPIDGTLALVKGRPHFAISAALALMGQAVAGCVFNPLTNEFFSAAHGHGATLNDKRITVSERAELQGARMLGAKDFFHHPEWRRPWPPLEIESRSSIAYRLALVAAGTWDACVTLSGKSDWDLAAGDIIVREAGGCVSDHTGAAFCYNRERTRHQSVIAAGPVLYAEILSRVAHIDLGRPR